MKASLVAGHNETPHPSPADAITNTTASTDAAPQSEAPSQPTPDAPHVQGGEGETRHRPKIVSFVSRSTRLKERQQRAWDELAPQFVISPPRDVARTSIDPDVRFDAREAFGREARLVVEIGSGQGECVASAAAQWPDTNFLPIEVYMPGIASTLYRIRRAELANVRVLQADAAQAVETYLPEAGVDEVWIFFPDPWHKARHHKRRLIQPYFLDRLTRVLRPGGLVRLATDWQDYADHMRETFDAHPQFTLHSTERFDGRPITSFERKGMEKDRGITDLAYTFTG